MKRPWYDIKEGLQHELTDLEGFHRIINAREEAAYQRDESLHEFYIMGRWYLDSVGNCGRAQEDGYYLVPKDRFPKIPDVLTRSEFKWFLDRHARDIGNQISSWAFLGWSVIAPVGIPCVTCGRTWELHDCHQCEHIPLHRTESLGDFVGKTLGEFKASLLARTDARYHVGREQPVRNDNCIDLRSRTDFPSLKVNQFGWFQADDSYVIKAGDEADVLRVTFTHPACRRRELAALREKEFSTLFSQAGYQSILMMRAPNEYGSESYRGPWFAVNTEVGTITIGWRKRVVNIDWSATGRDLLAIFSDVKDTKSVHYIHAYTDQQVVDYLRRIREALQGVTV